MIRRIPHSMGWGWRLLPRRLILCFSALGECWVWFFPFLLSLLHEYSFTFSPPVIARKAVILTAGPIAVLCNHRAFSVVKYNCFSVHRTEIGMHTTQRPHLSCCLPSSYGLGQGCAALEFSFPYLAYLMLDKNQLFFFFFK